MIIETTVYFHLEEKCVCKFILPPILNKIKSVSDKIRRRIKINVGHLSVLRGILGNRRKQLKELLVHLIDFENHLTSVNKKKFSRVSLHLKRTCNIPHQFKWTGKATRKKCL